MPRRNLWPAAFIVAASLAGCASTGEVAGPPASAKVEAIMGTDLHRVILTQKAADRLGITTELVRESPAAGTAVSVPFGAVIYDKDGNAWAYTNPAPLTYVRAKLTIGHVDGVLAELTAGPAAGTPVVTVGAAELVGAEYGVGGD
jgi:hypothetical protein